MKDYSAIKGKNKWELVQEPNTVDTCGNPVYYLNCPSCDFKWTTIHHAKYFRFCPNCGKSMLGE